MSLAGEVVAIGISFFCGMGVMVIVGIIRMSNKDPEPEKKLLTPANFIVHSIDGSIITIKCTERRAVEEFTLFTSNGGFVAEILTSSIKRILLEGKTEVSSSTERRIHV